MVVGGCWLCLLLRCRCCCFVIVGLEENNGTATARVVVAELTFRL